MGVALKVGEKIPLFMGLEDETATTKVVRARIFNAAGSQITGSPVTIAHVTLGEYFDESVLMVSTPSIWIKYTVFDGPGFTNPSPEFETLDDERFDLDDLGTAIDDLKLAARGKGLEATIEGTNLEATISDNTSLEATIEEGDLEATISQGDSGLEATIEAATLEGEIECST